MRKSELGRNAITSDNDLMGEAPGAGRPGSVASPHRDGADARQNIQLGEEARVASASEEWRKSKLPSSEKAGFIAGFAAALSSGTGCQKNESRAAAENKAAAAEAA